MVGHEKKWKEEKEWIFDSENSIEFDSKKE